MKPPSKELLERYAPLVERVRNGDNVVQTARDAGISTAHLRYVCRHSGLYGRAGKPKVDGDGLYEAIAWNGKITPGERCKCWLLLPCHSCTPKDATEIICKTSNWDRIAD